MKPFEKKVRLSSPTIHGDESKYMTEAYKLNWMSACGENINCIEKNIAYIAGCRNAVALSSGTSALHLAIKLAGIKAGDNVFCSDLTFNSTVNPILYEKANPIFIDSEYDTWNMDSVALEKAFEIYPETKFIVAVNLYGTPIKFDEICAIAEKHGAVIIEDASDSFGATYNGKQTGTFGKYNAISFNAKRIITGSSGGMLLTEDDEGADIAKKWLAESCKKASVYLNGEMGANYPMSDVVAGVIRGQIPYLEEHISKKKAIYERYKRVFSGLPVKMHPFDPEKMIPNFSISCLTIDEKLITKQTIINSQSCFASEPERTLINEVSEKLMKYNIESRLVCKPMHLQPFFGKYDFISTEGSNKSSITDSFAEKRKDVSADIFRRGICLPSDIKMTVEEQEIIIKIIISCFK